MPAYKFYASLNIKTLESGITHLYNRDNVYLVIKIFDDIQLTHLISPSFPLFINEKFCFEKLFYDTCSTYELVRKLEDIPVTIELRQISDFYNGGTLLAYFDGNARDFFAPCPTICSTSEQDREFLMMRTIDFSGTSPKVKFGTSTHISLNCSSAPEPEIYEPKQSSSPSYTRPTVTSILKSYSQNENFSQVNRTGVNPSRHANCFNSPGSSLNRRSTPLNFQRTGGNNYGENIFKCPRCTDGCVCAGDIRRTKSSSDLSNKQLQAAQERSDRYWHMYRFWQRELESLRQSR